MGVNLAVAPDVPGRPVACLANHAEPPLPEVFAQAVLARLGHWASVRAAEGFAPIRAAWLARAPEPGSAVTLRLGDQMLRGGFAGLGGDGSLLLVTEGRERAFTTGEVLL
jgi:BirA family biotin operon repressor/biotin-[acetyl-CoA-carboxylase] ligase